jgi:signal transduction histidine kinase
MDQVISSRSKNKSGVIKRGVIITNDTVQRLQLSTLLVDAGWRVTSFRNAGQALREMIIEEPPDIIVTDLHLDQLDSWRFCHLLRSSDYALFNGVPILIVSASYSADYAAAITEDVGADGFLSLPVQPETFCRTIASLTERKSCSPGVAVLVVEDNPVTAAMLDRVFQDYNWRVRSAKSGEEARACFFSTEIDLVIIDYHLPDEKGDQLLLAFKDWRPSAVCIMITADSTPEHALDWMEKGASAYLRKPFSAKYLVEVCLRARRERAWLRTEHDLDIRSRCLQRREEFIEDFENRSMQAQKLEAIGTLAAGITHDFNNILSPIIGYADLIKIKYADDAILRQHVEQILLAGSRAKELVQQILIFSRSEKNRQQPLALQSLVKECVKMARAFLPSRIAVFSTIAEDCPAVVGDPARFCQLLMNLITNSYHAMEEKGGKLTISLDSSEEKIEGEENREMVRLQVMDSGKGIGDEIVGRIFEPFFTTKEAGKGTGLGLSVVKTIVTDFRATIAVQSNMPAPGTTFTVDFPAFREKNNPTEARHENKYFHGNNQSVLLVDDNEDVLDYLSEVLRRLHFRPFPEHDSVKALAAFHGAPDSFDILFTDLDMPDLSGQELIREVLKVRPHMPVIVCTGNGDYTDVDLPHHMEKRIILQKPVTINDISSAMKTAFKVPVFGLLKNDCLDIT